MTVLPLNDSIPSSFAWAYWMGEENGLDALAIFLDLVTLQELLQAFKLP